MSCCVFRQKFGFFFFQNLVKFPPFSPATAKTTKLTEPRSLGLLGWREIFCIYLVFPESVNSNYSRVLIGSRNLEYPYLYLQLFSLPLKQSICESSNADLCGYKGICIPDYSKDSFTCKCDKGYAGTRCGKLQTSHPLGLFHLGGLERQDSNHLCIKCDLKLFIYLLAYEFRSSLFTRSYFESKVRERKAFSQSKEYSVIIEFGFRRI